MMTDTTGPAVRIEVPRPSAEPILAVGAELKSAPCLLDEATATLAGEIGNLADPQAYRAFVAAVENLLQGPTAADHPPQIVACDLHPQYAATRYARSLKMRVVGVQHHHAHVVSCMVDNGITGPVVGISCDGTGYGPDETIWGCEVLACDEADYRRAGRLRTFALPGGDAAAIETWRPAAGLLNEAFGRNWPTAAAEIFSRVEPEALKLARQRLASPSARLMRTSSLGRLFDAAAFLLGLCDRNDTEAQAPIALQSAAETCDSAEPMEWILNEHNGLLEMDPLPMIRQLLAAAAAGPVEKLARAFHESVAAMLADCTVRTCEATGRRRVVLSGGCFMNRLLRNRITELLEQNGLGVYIHRRVSTGDGGIALGQAVSAAARLENHA